MDPFLKENYFSAYKLLSSTCKSSEPLVYSPHFLNNTGTYLSVLFIGISETSLDTLTPTVKLSWSRSGRRTETFLKSKGIFFGNSCLLIAELVVNFSYRSVK